MVNVLKLRNANNDVEPDWQSTASVMPIKTDYLGEKAFIYGSINGVDGFKFMIDTGASFTVLFDTAKIRALNLPKGYDLNLSGWGDEQKSLAYQTTMATLKFADMQVSDFDGAYIKASKTKYFLDAQELIYDGVIGHDLLRHFAWTFDKQANQVTIANKSYTPLKTEQELEFDTFMSKISVEGKLDFGNGHQVEHEFIIDTGSRHYLKLSSAYPEGNNVILPEAKISAADFGLSGKAEHQRVTLPRLNLGLIKLNNIKTNLIKTDDEDDYWVIGNAALNQFITTVDYLESKVYLAPYENHNFKSRYNLLGLELRKLLSGDFIVRFVMPGLPGDKAGFNVGDIINQFNGTNASEISHDDWLSLTAQPGQYKICLKTSKCYELQSTHIKGYSN